MVTIRFSKYGIKFQSSHNLNKVKIGVKMFLFESGIFRINCLIRHKLHFILSC